MHKILAYPLTIVYLLCFFLTLVIMHPVQWFCFNVFGYQVHKKSVDFLQLLLMRCAHLLGTRFTFNNIHEIDRNQPLIIVANHQSLHDIYPLTWYMRKHHPKFISKIELGKGIPSVSYNLRHGGAALIDRKNPRQSLPALMKFGEYIEKNKGVYVSALKADEIKTDIESTNSPIILEGVCLLMAAKAIDIQFDVLIYIKRMHCGLWQDQDVCEPPEDISAFLEQERKELSLFMEWDASEKGEEPPSDEKIQLSGLTKEIIRYHGDCHPSLMADFIFKVTHE